MEEIDILAEYVAIGVNILAIAAIAVGSIQGAVGLARGLLTNASEDDLRPVWLAFGRWLVAGLTFQLASDIVETTFAPTWDDIGKLGAIAVIRTFLNYFLNKDMNELRERGREEAREGRAEKRP
ncbi:DUF1622 domain-containing protein [Sphingopyxis indica]|uniref:Uncharacterized membrane protein n=1 Tax=Sphingopyxis indica TaxID=436663 RepID=A0A239JNJ7_9SPHN|nr:DUF1622 domain-containing protein [Sphingopyxis indica]WOF43739.1 DUF1622 domain-containing protein [Sphingopyxis indica]SNT07339.1 Uncharacterized membrane protein [Sphingopyxis indica]